MKLSRRQVTTLVLLAKRAFLHLQKQAAARGDGFDASKLAFDNWRRGQVFAACGRHGLSLATNDDYRKIHAQFSSVLGQDGVAFEDLLKAGTEKTRQLRWVLDRELSEASLHPQYADAIAIGKFHCPVSDLQPDQLRQVLMTVKARVAARRNKASQASQPQPY